MTKKLLLVVPLLAVVFFGFWFLFAESVAACSFRGVLQAPLQVQNQKAATASLLSASRIVERDGALYELWATPEGDYWIPHGAAGLFFVLAEQQRGLYESPAVSVKPDDIVLDAGANVGVFVRTALEKHAKLVVAIEPVPQNLEALRRNFRKEIADGRVVLYPKGVWNTEGVLPMWVYPNSVLDSFVLSERPESPEEAQRVDLPLTTIDEIVEELGLPRVDFIKLDVEGAERQALEGAEQTIRRFTPRLAVATENLADDYTVLPKAIGKFALGYDTSFGVCMVMPGSLDVRPEVAFFSTALSL